MKCKRAGRKPTEYLYMTRPFRFSDIVGFLQNNPLVANIKKIHIDEVSKRGVYKIKCQLIPSKYNLEIKYIKTSREFIYSYQLFSTDTMMRWDNEPHYPDIKSYPHHFHDTDGQVSDSDLTGDAERDLKKVISKIKNILFKNF